MAWAANFGELTLKNVSAPEACGVTTCESTVGSVDSYEATATLVVV